MISLHDKIKEITSVVSSYQKIQTSNLEYVSIFTKNSDEFDFYSEEALKLGSIVLENNSGIVVKLNSVIESEHGIFEYLKIRKPDSARSEIGALDFYLPDFDTHEGDERFFKTKNSNNIEILVDQKHENSESVVIAYLKERIGAKGLEKSSMNVSTELEKELEEEKKKFITLMADFQNYRKRVESEKATFGALANMSLIQELLEIYDDLQLAMQDENLNLENARMSMKTAQDKLSTAARNAGIERVDINIGDDFDSTKMEAIQSIPDENNKGKVIAVISSAYKYANQDGILKSGKVVVGK